MAIPAKPDAIAFPPTEINRHGLELYILEYLGPSTFNTCPHQPRQTWKGKPLNITHIPGTTPTTVHTPLTVPKHWNQCFKQDTHWDLALGIIEAYKLVLKNGVCTKEGRTTQTYGGYRKTQCRHREGDSAYSIPFFIKFKW